MPSGQPHEAFKPAYRSYVLVLITIAYVFSFVDRQVMTILIEPIKHEFGASDTQMGFLSGLAFALFYATLGLPVARLADRWSRTKVLSLALTTWSGMTALCATATGFWHLALLRFGVGIGEAGGTPPAQSLLADYFPPERRAFAQGVFATGPNFGVLIGLFGGAMLAQAYGWRSVFVIFGLPGIAVALLLYLTVREPARVAPMAETDDSSLWRAVVGIARLPSFMFIALGVGFSGIAGYGLGAWLPSFLVRVHSLSLVEAGFYLGMIGVVGGSLGTILSGILVDRLSQRDPRWQLRVPALGLAAGLPFLLLFLLWPESDVITLGERQIPFALPFMLVSSVFGSFWIAPAYAAVQNLVPQHWRTQAAALLLFVFNLLGLGLGPLVVGMLSDSLSHLGEESIRYAMVASLATMIIGVQLFWSGSTPYARRLQSGG